MGIFRILRNYGADFLWLWSYAFALAPFLRGLFPKKYLGVLFGVCTGTGILFEGLQGLEVFRGTADFWDVAVYFTAAVSGCLIIKQISKRGAVK